MSKFTLEKHLRKIVTPLMFSSYVFFSADEGNNIFDICHQSETAIAICAKNTDANGMKTNLVEIAGMCFNSVSVDSVPGMPEKNYSRKEEEMHFSKLKPHMLVVQKFLRIVFESYVQCHLLKKLSYSILFMILRYGNMKFSCIS